MPLARGAHQKDLTCPGNQSSVRFLSLGTNLLQSGQLTVFIFDTECFQDFLIGKYLGRIKKTTGLEKLKLAPI